MPANNVVRFASLFVVGFAAVLAQAQKPETATIAKKGKDWEAKVTYPRFANPSPVQKFAQQQLEKSAREDLREFLRSTADIPKHPNYYPAGMELSTTYEITFNSPTMISGYTEVSSYTQGGAHGDLSADTWTFALVKGKPTALKRKSFFKPHTDYKHIASKVIKPMLLKKNGSDNEMLNDMKYADMNSVCISPTGITWVFGAYQVAPFSEGNVAITVPWKDLKNSIDWHGPLKPFAKSGKR